MFYISVLYKYKPYSDDRLESDFISGGHWCSGTDDLNDPFDIQLLYPENLSPNDKATVSSICAKADLARVKNVSPNEIADFIGNSKIGLAPLEELFLVAIQLGDKNLLRHLWKIEISDEWIDKLFSLSLLALKDNLGSVAIFCLSEKNNNRLMWAHYGNSFKGYCIGYLTPTGIQNPRAIHKVQYKEKNHKIRPLDIILKPGQSVIEAITTKSPDWSYESEWRFIMGPDRGLCSKFFPIHEVIFGNRMPEDQKDKIKSMLKGQDIRFFIASPIKESSAYEVQITEE